MDLRSGRFSRSFIIALSAVVLLLAIPTASAGETSDSTKLRQPEPPAKGIGEKFLDVFSEVLKLPVYPVKGLAYGAVWTATESPLREIIFRPPVDFSVYPVASYSSNAGLKGGLGMFYKNLFQPGDILRAKAYYSTHLYQRYGLSLNSPRLFSDRIGLDLSFDYRKRPWESFYGLGNDSREGDEVSYTLEQTSVGATLGWCIHPSFRVGVFGSYAVSNISDGRSNERIRVISEIADTLGLRFEDYRSSRHVTIGLCFEHDSRDHPGQTLRGGEEKARFAYNRGVKRTEDLKYYEFTAEASQYLHLGRKRVLLGKVNFQRVSHDEAAPPIPFYLRTSLGGETGLHGYRTRRFVDNDLLLVTFEYRYPIWTKLDAFIFHEEGRVFGSMFDDFAFEEWKLTTGMGVRAWGQDGEVGRVLFAVGKEGVRFYVHMGADW
jgi:outer membrane protein assembly factor BamA